ncbi:MAG TPA: hypothetical protein VGJ07_00430 [Rugosimonospora sp.]
MFGTDVAESKSDATVGTPRGLLVARMLGSVRSVGPILIDADRSALPGRVLSILSLAPVCVLTGWVLAAFPLAALGVFRPLVVIPVATVGAVIVLWMGLALLRAPRPAIRAPWWSVVVTTAIAVGFGLFTAFTHSEHVIPRRDAGSYIQIGYWLAHHQALTYPFPAAAFGPSPGNLGFGSPAFYEHGTVLVPQFMTGWPILLAAVDWGWGWGGMLVLPAAVGGCAILAVAGLTARLVGACWAPLAALLLACVWPVLRVAQSTFSEPLALLILAGGSCLLVDLVLAAKADAAGQIADRDTNRIRRLAFVAGLVLAGGELVRLDFGIDFALTLPVLAGLWLVCRRAVWPFLVGAAISGGLGLVDGAFVTRPYVQVNMSSVKLMVVAMVAVIVVTLAGMLVARRYGRSLWASRWWRLVPIAGGVAVLAVAVGFLVRPYVSVDHSVTDAGVRQFTETAQRRLGLPLDGTRGYGEQSLWWVSWYLGWPVLAAALAGAVALTTRVLRGRDIAWAGVLLVYLGSSVLTLLRPGITPDHPWADRRLVVEVLPGMVLFATWTVAAVNRWLRSLAPRHGSGAVGPAAVRRWAARAGVIGLAALPWAATAVVVVVLIAPVWSATRPVAKDRTELGELAAMAGVCRALHTNDSVVLTDTLWAPTIRAQCHVPVAYLIDPTRAALNQVTASIRSAGRTPVIAGTQHDALSALGLEPTRAVRLKTQQDQQQLIQRPDGTMPLMLDFWLARP